MHNKFLHAQRFFNLMNLMPASDPIMHDVYEQLMFVELLNYFSGIECREWL